jgi:transcriptional regulator with XRE-family HTH domain
MKLRQIADIRYDLNQSQAEFWGRFGVNQRSGSRIERGQVMPLPISILVRLYLDGVISEADLDRANRKVRIERAL